MVSSILSLSDDNAASLGRPLQQGQALFKTVRHHRVRRAPAAVTLVGNEARRLKSIFYFF
jgi:hypothetical protein